MASAPKRTVKQQQAKHLSSRCATPTRRRHKASARRPNIGEAPSPSAGGFCFPHPYHHNIAALTVLPPQNVPLPLPQKRTPLQNPIRTVQKEPYVQWHKQAQNIA